MTKRRQPRVLLIELPANRDYTGRISLLDSNGQIIEGPFDVCGRSGDELSTEHGNPSRATTLPYGDSPLGTYRIIGFLPTGSGTPYRADLFGAYGAFVLEAKGGDAALADANGRFEILIHGGSLSSDGGLRATSGNMRMADEDLRILAKLIRRPSDVLCECVLASHIRASNFVDRQNAEDTTAETLPTSTWITPRTDRLPVPMLVAYGEYESGPSTQTGQEQTIDASAPSQSQSDDFTVSSGNEANATNVPYVPPATRPEDQASGSDQSPSTPEALSSVAEEAYQASPDACNNSTAYVAEAYGVNDLSGKKANDQVDFMDANWDSISAEKAQELANQGQLVIAGLKSADAGKSGHTAIVVPGDGAVAPDGNYYPNVKGGGTGLGKSDGSKTAGQVWGRTVRSQVKYYVPRTSQ